MILDLGHFRFVNDKEPESSSNSNFVEDIDDDDGIATHIMCAVGFVGIKGSMKNFTLYFAR